MTPEIKTQKPYEDQLILADQEEQLVDQMIQETLTAPRTQMRAQDIAELMEIKSLNHEEDQRRAALFMSVGFVMSLLLIIGAFEWKTYDDQELVDLNYSATKFEELAEIPLTEQPPPPPPSTNTAQIIFNEVPDEQIIEEIKIDLDVEITSDMAVEDVVFEMTEPEEEEVEEIFTIVEEQPQPVGGYEAFYASIRDKLRYPDEARRAGVEGKVFLQFVVQQAGTISDIAVAKGIGWGCDEAAVTALKGGPNWNPGKQRGRPVKVRIIVPIVFKMAK